MVDRVNRKLTHDSQQLLSTSPEFQTYHLKVALSLLGHLSKYPPIYIYIHTLGRDIWTDRGRVVWWCKKSEQFFSKLKYMLNDSEVSSFKCPRLSQQYEKYVCILLPHYKTHIRLILEKDWYMMDPIILIMWY